MIYRRAKEITASIDQWFKEFEIPYQLKIKQVGDAVTGEILVMTLVDKRIKVPVAPSDVGFGIGQLLPIIVEGAMARNKILCVEQPEIHLHPRLQAHVADLLIATAGLLSPKDGGRSPLRNQWIVETHSESLMLRLQRRMREGQIRPDDVSVLYVEPGGANGSRIMQLRLNEHGEFIDEWPQGFFEERYAEVFEETD
jgi:predicted ATPase